ncbi:hypothetical protein B0H17DRAFT_1135072 [Mycena rosella]|uniref:Uncharacterized protein n=1 Tax=Mycena rosella TaxID=1033263 RepID=A0AAD7DFT2_MYCRO|nr:hypothetical protein B0H17DRAFT_1135072 [Mycena rosella]
MCRTDRRAQNARAKGPEEMHGDGGVKTWGASQSRAGCDVATAADATVAAWTVGTEVVGLVPGIGVEGCVDISRSRSVCSATGTRRVSDNLPVRTAKGCGMACAAPCRSRNYGRPASNLPLTSFVDAGTGDALPACCALGLGGGDGGSAFVRYVYCTGTRHWAAAVLSRATFIGEAAARAVATARARYISTVNQENIFAPPWASASAPHSAAVGSLGRFKVAVEMQAGGRGGVSDADQRKWGVLAEKKRSPIMAMLRWPSVTALGDALSWARSPGRTYVLERETGAVLLLTDGGCQKQDGKGARAKQHLT